ncbi:hypothetical protein [Cohnella candidum]|uniref:Lipoprotein n=1 Tax=Cohnella candidum TaxID=2674991 RepID=A0A3G3K299_9BACL|nr:hypothetical protein [Cohnella candidum]AYQ74626.1 hypothetical protein EAV92_19865 [Cohnella candidum]
MSNINSQTKKWTVVLSALMLAIGLAGCGKNSENKASSTPGASAPTASSSASAPGNDSSDLPATKEFTIKQDGKESKETGKLTQGQGFTLYVLDGYSFVSMLSLLTLSADQNYYAHIEKLAAGYSLDDLKKTASEQLAKVGSVSEIAGQDQNALLGGTALMLTASSDKLTQQVIVKIVKGSAYRIDLNVPKGGSEQTFLPHIYASVGSIANSNVAT